MENTRRLQRISIAGITVFVIVIPMLVFGETGLPTGEGIKTWIVTLAGNALIIVAIIFAIKNFIQQKWGAMVALLIGGAFVAWIIWFPESFVGLLKAIATAIGG